MDSTWTRWCSIVFGMVFISALSAQTELSTKPRSSPTAALVREEQTVIIDGIDEVWRLEWEAPPKWECGPDSEMSGTCPCGGFAFGESGKLDLVRSVNGRDIDRLTLPQFFGKTGQWAADGITFEPRDTAIVQRWELQEQDIDALFHEREKLTERVQSRPAVKIMNFADYDGDGHATEFFLQTEVEPCGKPSGVVLGISRTNPHLHAFTSALHPEEPLHLFKREWEALPGPNRVVHWRCGDHASEEEVEYNLRSDRDGIHVHSWTYDCTDQDERGHLTREDDL